MPEAANATLTRKSEKQPLKAVCLSSPRPEGILHQGAACVVHADPPRRGDSDDGRGEGAEGDGRGADIARACPRAATVTAVAMAVVAMAVAMTTAVTMVAVTMVAVAMTTVAMVTTMMTAVAPCAQPRPPAPSRAGARGARRRARAAADPWRRGSAPRGGRRPWGAETDGLKRLFL